MKVFCNKNYKFELYDKVIEICDKYSEKPVTETELLEVYTDLMELGKIAQTEKEQDCVVDVMRPVEWEEGMY